MRRDRYLEFRDLAGKTVRMRTTEGEDLRAVVNLSSPFDRDLTYRPLGTNQPERYAGDPPGAWSVIPWDYIDTIEEVLDPAPSAGQKTET